MTTGFKPQAKPKKNRSPSSPQLSPEQQRERDEEWIPTPAHDHSPYWMTQERSLWVQTSWVDHNGEEQVINRKVKMSVREARENIDWACNRKFTLGKFNHCFLIDGTMPKRYLAFPPKISIWHFVHSIEHVPDVLIEVAPKLTLTIGKKRYLEMEQTVCELVLWCVLKGSDRND